MANSKPKIDHLKATQWPPGKSGNPAGLPKGTLHLSTRIQNMLNDKSFKTWLRDPREGVKEYKGVALDAVIGTTIQQAISGDAKAREWLAKYGWGQKYNIEASVEQEPSSASDPELAEAFRLFMLGYTKGKSG